MFYRWIRYISVLFGLYIFFACFCLAQNSEMPSSRQDWVYRDLDLLYQEGYLQNYSKEWVQSGNKLSRFEIAYYIKQILTLKIKNNNVSLIPQSVTNVLQKLIVEFRDELEALGIKITDISKISPNLVDAEVNPEEYQDLDVLIKGRNRSHSDIKQEPCYYFGQYFQSLQKKTFVFIPSKFVNSSDLGLLNNALNNINIVFSKQLGQDRSFLVMQGELPLQGETALNGYYLFPVEENLGLEGNFLNGDDSVLSLLDGINQVQQIEYIWKFNGVLSFAGYSRKETNFQSKVFLGNIKDGLKVGGLLLFSPNSLSSPTFETTDFGLPFYGISQSPASAAVDLDNITDSSLESMLINIHGSLAINPQTSIYGGLDIVYRKSQTSALFENVWPSDTKASAGVSYQMNGYWTLLTYQSFVNSQVKSKTLSTTSIGLEYDDWVTFWLAYQMLDFGEPVLTGAFTFRF